MLADDGQHGLDSPGVEGARARHALERDVVDVAAGHAGHLLHACFGAGRGQQEDQVHAVRTQAGGKRFALLGRVVDHQHAIDACGSGIAHKGPWAADLVVAFHGIGITHEHHGGRAVALAEAAHHLEDLGQADAQRQGLLAGLLNHRTISHGV